ncbi:V-set and transmembrane domain-containing protein 2A [Limanda limanda]|uniref:V-set and transmembrane domain-containing protein 2A n=1 Tax=Limanda limanda TaxID=27771 RepID=UPI0029C9AF31|nr:V-set and transmembrane domain-containing protein 2A [Limanda limanda]
MMWTSHDTVGFVFLAGFCVQFGFSFEGRFTDLPSNMTVKEGQNIEMACAFQSGTTSVYLEIQWWFVKTPEPTDSEEVVNTEEMEMIPEPDPDDEGTKISTVKVQGNDISHKLQMSRVSKSDEGLYECRVTRANYGEIVEYKVQAWLKVNATARPRRPLTPPKKSSPLHLTDKKPRKSSSSQDSMSPDQRVSSTSTSHTSSNTAQQNPGSAAQTALATFYEQQRGVELRATEFYYSCAQVGDR